MLARGGVDRVALNTHHLPEAMARVAREEGARRDLAITTVHEPVIQGTGGGLRGLARALPGDEVVIAWNGDILFAPDLAPLLEEHRTSGAAATLVLLPMPEGKSYGVVETDAQGRVHRIGRPAAALAPGRTEWHFSGVHLLSPAVFAAMRPDAPEDINHDVYPRLFGARRGARSVVVDVPWSDLGSPVTYLEAQSDLLLGQVADPLGVDSPLAGRTRDRGAGRAGGARPPRSGPRARRLCRLGRRGARGRMPPPERAARRSERRCWGNGGGGNSLGRKAALRETLERLIAALEAPGLSFP